MNEVLLPLGIDSFEKLRTEGYYYIDKTRFIAELLTQGRFEVNLITRPRRFGKTLTMSMLADFLDIRKDSRTMFEGLEISENVELCKEWMNQWPVLFLTFKDIEDLAFADAYGQLVDTVSDLCVEHAYLLESDKVDADDKKRFAVLKSGEAENKTVRNSLYLLTRMMQAHYGKSVILLIDEYDVPLAKANEHGHYERMLNCIRGVLSKALKTNRSLKFAVITGCLRIAKESIFTGTNHFVSNSISSDAYSDIFGFTKQDVDKLLTDAGLKEHAEEIRHWYDGYRICNSDIYCPWDVLNYVKDLKKNSDIHPGCYWKDTSHNDIIRSFIGQQDFNVTEQFETLLSGGCIRVRLCDDLTYDLVHSSEENFWSILYLTGYLTNMRLGEAGVCEELEPGESCLRIPNEEIRTIFAETVVEWFKDNMKATNRTPLMTVLWSGEEEKASVMLTDLLFQTISYHNYKEDYYQAFLAGIFTGLGYAVESDKEYGEGRPDLVVKDSKNRRVMIIEAKHSKSQNAMEHDCETAVDQVEVRKYAHDFLDGYNTIVCYGAVFFRKQCLVKRIEIKP